ncbi:MAG: L-threonylcarbamoyladenylate synthase [Anaerolineae bacterium]
MQDAERIPTKTLPAGEASAVDEALRALRQGELVVFPTDTVYGVGCDVWRAEAVEKLYWAKGRPAHLAIPVLVSSQDALVRVARALPKDLGPLAEAFWPGALTVVVRRAPDLPAILTAGEDTVAVRMPDDALALALIEGMDEALAVTSANLSGRPSPVTAQDALRDLGGRVAVVLDGGTCPGGVASSIVDLVSDPPVLLRQGGLSLEALQQVLPRLVARGQGVC